MTPKAIAPGSLLDLAERVEGEGRLPDGEQWRQVVGYEGLYIVSNLGRVRSARVNAPILRGDIDRYGYSRVLLSADGIKKRKKVHRLVCEAFNGPAPVGLQVAHLDGNKANNHHSNLMWASAAENMAHNVLHGLSVGCRGKSSGVRGERHPSAKLTENLVAEMRAKAAQGRSERSLAAEYGISPSAAHNIIRRKTWKTM